MRDSSVRDIWATTSARMAGSLKSAFWRSWAISTCFCAGTPEDAEALFRLFLWGDAVMSLSESEADFFKSAVFGVAAGDCGSSADAIAGGAAFAVFVGLESETAFMF
ncbi:MAG: hypothetical protein ACKOAS_03825 [Verrucomicrobiota bacterium]